MLLNFHNQFYFSNSSSFFFRNDKFLISYIFLYKQNLSGSMFFMMQFLYFNRSFEWNENKIKEHLKSFIVSSRVSPPCFKEKKSSPHPLTFPTPGSPGSWFPPPPQVKFF